MRRTFILPALLAGALALGACTAPAATDPDTVHGEHMAPAEPDTDTEGSDAVSPDDGEWFNPSDIAFAAGMIPHHEQAVEMSDIVLDHGDLDPEVATLAEQIRAVQQPEIDQLTQWLEAWGVPHAHHESDHHDMPGMMSEADLEALAAADGAEASRLFLEQMIIHHEGAVEMAQVQLDQGRHDGARAMAREIIDAQEAEIAQMRSLLEGR